MLLSVSPPCSLAIGTATDKEERGTTGELAAQFSWSMMSEDAPLHDSPMDALAGEIGIGRVPVHELTAATATLSCLRGNATIIVRSVPSGPCSESNLRSYVHAKGCDYRKWLCGFDCGDLCRARQSEPARSGRPRTRRPALFDHPCGELPRISRWH